MYRLVLYVLVALIAAAMVLSFFNRLPYSPFAILYSTSILVAICWVSNKVFAKLLNIPINIESSLITGLILALIISPPSSGEYFSILPFLLMASFLAMSSKYLVNIGKKHIFNPAAFAVFITGIIISQSASWWVGTASMLPVVLVCGVLMVRKLRQFDLVIAFITSAFITTLVVTSFTGNTFITLERVLTASALFFFASIMLTEPLTMPPNRDGRIAYGILVGMLFSPQTHMGSVYFSPELALLIGNIFAYIVSPKGRHLFIVKEIQKAGDGIYNFVLQKDKQFKFKPGQYMEWTLGHKSPDSRGNRRYFTLASSPTEKETILGVKFYNQPSSFKRKMAQLKPGDTIYGSQLSGDFVMPDDRREKLAFIGGGIGVTPFRSMIKYLLDRNEKRDVALIYSARALEEISYADIFETGREKFGFNTVYTLTDQAPTNWRGYTGYVSPNMIRNEIPDYLERTFYISGSHQMVTASKNILSSMGVSKNKIRTDFFPGLA